VRDGDGREVHPVGLQLGRVFKVPDGRADVVWMRDARRTPAVVIGLLVALLLAAGITSAVTFQSRSERGTGNASALGTGVADLATDAPTTTMSTVTTTAPAQTATLPSTPSPSTPAMTLPRPATTTSTLSSRPSGPGGSPPSTTLVAPGSLPVRSTRTSFGPVDTTGVEVPFAPGQTSWSGVSNGIRITVRADKSSPRTGEDVAFDVELSSATHVCCGLIMWFGDGGGYQKDNGWACPEPTSHGPTSYRTTHTYNVDGRWTFVVYPISGDCAEPMVQASLFGALEVQAGTSAAQGPSLPAVNFDYSVPPAGHETDRTWLSVAGKAEDPDGWLRTFTVDWGDGSAPEVIIRGGTTGQESPAGWPQSSLLVILTGAAVHHFAAPGAYTVTATAKSTACDGSTPQQGSGAITWRA
jgi:hypothetical protein